MKKLYRHGQSWKAAFLQQSPNREQKHRAEEQRSSNKAQTKNKGPELGLNRAPRCGSVCQVRLIRSLRLINTLRALTRAPESNGKFQIYPQGVLTQSEVWLQGCDGFLFPLLGCWYSSSPVPRSIPSNYCSVQEKTQPSNRFIFLWSSKFSWTLYGSVQFWETLEEWVHKYNPQQCTHHSEWVLHGSSCTVYFAFISSYKELRCWLLIQIWVEV